MSLMTIGCEQLGLDLSEEQKRQFDKYLQLLLEWNEKFNLTAIREPDKIVVNHFLDSLSVLQAGLIKDGMSLLDIGTGAGFPAIPLKIAMPTLDITLVDSVNKKVVFLNELIKVLGLKDTIALHGRAEDLARRSDMRQSYDIVVARAVAQLRILLEYTIPFVRAGGFSIYNKGPGVEAELEDSQGAANILGGGEPRHIEAFVPFSDRTHNLVIIEKARQTPNKYPRSPGQPKKSPL